MIKCEQMYEGKAKKVFATDDENYCIVSYKDDATAFNGVKKGTIVGKGVVNNKMTNYLMRKLTAEADVPTHFVEELSDRETLVKRVKIVPLEVIIRNIAAGSFSKRFGVPEGTELKCPTLEYCLKDDALGDPMINDSQITALGVATQEELDLLKSMSLRVDELMTELFAKAGIRLIDFKLEFGRVDGGEIVLCDEISPDSCRLWDAKTNEKMDKDRFRRDMGGVMEGYKDVLARLTK